MNWTASDRNPATGGNVRATAAAAGSLAGSVAGSVVSAAAVRFLARLPRCRDGGAVFGLPLYLPATGRAVVPVLRDERGWLCRDLTDSAGHLGAGAGRCRGAGMAMVWASTVEIETATMVDLCHRSLLLRGGFPAGDRRFPLVWQTRVHHLVADPLAHRAARVLGQLADGGRHPLAGDLSGDLSGDLLSGAVLSLEVTAGWAVPIDERAEWQLLRGVQLVRRAGLGRLLHRLHTAGLLASGWRVMAGGLRPVWWLVLPMVRACTRRHGDVERGDARRSDYRHRRHHTHRDTGW